jgi:nitrogen-specific signal transduction histidine kinase
MDAYEILDNISTSVIITDRFMKITHVNTAAESLLSSSKSILKNTKIDSLFSTQ